MHGVLVIDKPSGRSSAQVVEHLRRALRAGRAGHGGTLDPLATGVLAICLGGATKLAQYLLADDKAYEAEGVLGVETDTLDRAGTVTRTRPVEVTEARLRAALAARTGEQDQVPPMYSAIKQGGVRLYARARAGEEVERAPRRIRVDRLELLAFAPPRFRVAIACTKGTYVRSLIADLGEDVGCGAHLAELRRTRSGRFTIDQALTLDAVAALGPAGVRDALIPLGRVTDLPVVAAGGDLVAAIRSGIQLAVEALGDLPAGRFQLVDHAGRLVAIAHADTGRVAYDRVFPDDATS